jgi:acyl-CoA thioester hydrolase
MIVKETKIRVRYGETDQMKVVYHGTYPQYFEVGRVEALRELGSSYNNMEKEGTILPVVSLEMQFLKSAVYDDVLTVRSTIKEKPSSKLTFYNEILNENGDLLVTGKVILVFVNINTRRPCRPPSAFMEIINPFFDS